MHTKDLDTLDTQQRQPGHEHKMDPEPEYMPRFPGSDRLKGKTAIISGGDSGIGRATAILFAREGANVTIAYLDEHEDAKLTRDKVEAEGGRALLMSGDIGHKEFCAEVVEKTRAEFGGLDVVICNAAEQHAREEGIEISEEQRFRTCRTNIGGHFYMVQAALRILRRVHPSSARPPSPPIAGRTC